MQLRPSSSERLAQHPYVRRFPKQHSLHNRNSPERKLGGNSYLAESSSGWFLISSRNFMFRHGVYTATLTQAFDSMLLALHSLD